MRPGGGAPARPERFSAAWFSRWGRINDFSAVCGREFIVKETSAPGEPQA
jgi:hypothetical protein